jgi:CheY-like chemotaxis protein
MAEQRSIRVLVVDDEVYVVGMLVDLLTEAGCTVATADDGYMALQRVMEERPDVIVLDFRMPHLDGFGAARRLKAHPEFCSIPIVGLTALCDEQTRQRAIDEGIDVLLYKPAEPREILRAVRGLADRTAAVADPVV